VKGLIEQARLQYKSQALEAIAKAKADTKRAMQAELDAARASATAQIAALRHQLANERQRGDVMLKRSLEALVEQLKEAASAGKHSSGSSPAQWNGAALLKVVRSCANAVYGQLNSAGGGQVQDSTLDAEDAKRLGLRGKGVTMLGGGMASVPASAAAELLGEGAGSSPWPPCPGCLAPTAPGAKFCGGCGRAQGASSPASAPVPPPSTGVASGTDLGRQSSMPQARPRAEHPDTGAPPSSHTPPASSSSAHSA
ncbi:unnamed protein product, partial [Symbiodinium sp. KB8]